MPNHIYSFKYEYNNSEICKLESRQIFNDEEKNKMLFSDIKVAPSISPFIKSRFDVIVSSENYDDLITNIKKKDIRVNGFKAEYLVLEGDTTEYTQRLAKLKDVGFSIYGYPDYQNPNIVYSICYFENVWYFGVLIKHNLDWYKHKKKPCSFSSSLNMEIAKMLVSIASKGNKKMQLLDACCGVGTVMLEACISGFNIDGCDINQKACDNTKTNLAHFNYTANVYCSDIKDLDKKYDAAIVDLPYNICTHSNDEIVFDIIAAAAKCSKRIVIVSISDIESFIKKTGFKITDFSTVDKRRKSKFTRNIWVCEKDSSED